MKVCKGISQHMGSAVSYKSERDKKRERGMGPGDVNVGTGYRRNECLFKLPFATKQGEREIPYPPPLSLSLSPPLDHSFLPSLQMSGM